jgi:phage baseplate assembly protein V
MSRIDNVLARAIVRLVGDSSSRQTAQLEVTKGELLDDVPRMQNYGFTGVPPAQGTDATVVFLGGDRNEPIIVAMENRQFRLVGLESGEVAIYDNLGNVIKLGQDQVEVAAVTKLVGTAPIIELTATTSGKLVAGASSITVAPSGVAIVSPVLTHNGKNIGNTHYHVGSPNTAVPV